MIGELRDESVGSKVLVLVEREVAGGTRLMDSEEETYWKRHEIVQGCVGNHLQLV